MITLFPIFPLFILISTIVVIALVSIILDNFEENNRINSGLFVLTGVILTLAIIGFIVALQKTIQAFTIKEAEGGELAGTDTDLYLKKKFTSGHDFAKYLWNLILLLLFNVVVVALSSVIVEEYGRISPSSYIFAVVILAFSAFTLLLLIIFIIIRIVEFCKLPKDGEQQNEDLETVSATSIAA
jgi:hypothetical protein